MRARARRARRATWRRTRRSARRARGRSWSRPSRRSCPCRGGGRCPGRSTPPMPERSLQWCSSALTSVPLAWPAAGWTTSPAGLSITIRSASSYRIASGMASGTRLERLGRRARRPRSRRRRAARAGLGRDRAGDRHPPVLDQPLDLRARQLGDRARRSRRRGGPPACAASTISSYSSLVVGLAPSVTRSST